MKLEVYSTPSLSCSGTSLGSGTPLSTFVLVGSAVLDSVDDGLLLVLGSSGLLVSFGAGPADLEGVVCIGSTYHLRCRLGSPGIHDRRHRTYSPWCLALRRV